MNTPATNDSLARAIAFLGAVEVAPGKYAFRWKRGAEGYGVATRRQLATFAKYIEKQSIGLAYELWILGKTELPSMPSWWSPEQREAWAVANVAGVVKTRGLVFGCWYPEPDETAPGRYTSPQEAERNRGFSERLVRITADVDTGAEVPC